MAEETTFDASVDPTAQLKRGVTVLRRSWFLLCAMLLAGLIIGVGLFLFMPQEYEAEAKIMLRGRWMLDGGSETRAPNVPLTVRASLLQDQLKSSEWLETVLDRLEWPEWARAKRGDISQKEFVAKVKSKIRVTVEKGETGEGLVFLRFRWDDRFKVRDFVKGLRDQWVAEVFESAKDDLDREIAIRQGQLRDKNQTLDDLRKDLEQYETRRGINQLAPATFQDRSDKMIARQDTLQGDIANIQAQEGELDRLLNERGPDGVLLIPSTLSSFAPIANDEYQDRLLQIELLSKELAKLRARTYTEKHAQVRSVMARLRDALIQLGDGTVPEVIALDENVTQNPEYARLQAELQRLQIRLKGLRAQQAQIDQGIKRVDGILETLPGQLREMQQRQFRITLQKDVVTLSRIELQPLLDKQEALVSLGPQALPYTTLEEPSAPTAPSQSMGLMALGGSVAVMLALGVALVLARELFKSSFTSSEQARKVLTIPVLGEVAPIRTELEARKQRLAKFLHIAASMVLLAGLATTVWVCSQHPELLPSWLVDRAAELREGLA